MTVTSTRHDRIAVLTIDNPPVNAISTAVRAALHDRLQACLADPGVSAIVLAGAGSLFSGGADIREFGQPVRADVPDLPALIAFVEQSPVPVVAALHGTVVGGALELALGCHARVAAPETRLGLPEVTLGFIPGAGGTQRLPRLAGLDAALRMILTGDRITAAEALSLGLVDEVAAGDVVDAALAVARKVAHTPPRRTCDLAAPADDPAIVDRHQRQLAKDARGRVAPQAALDSVRHGLRVPFAEGVAHERAAFLAMVSGTEARALRHAFFAERAARKVPGLADDTARLPIRSAAVIGSGTMGTGIAMCFANAAIPVSIYDADPSALERGLAGMRRIYDTAVSKKKMTPDEAARRLAMIDAVGSIDAVADADIVVEAAFEDMAVKRDVFARLDAVCRADAVLATNTSSLDVNEIARQSRHPERVIGLHFFSPAHVMRLVEVVRPDQVSLPVLATSLEVVRTIGKLGVVVGVCDGFVGNRMLFAYRQQANFLLEEGATPAQVDRAITTFGLPMGPYQMGDLAGLDISWRIRKRQAATRPPHLRYSRIADVLCERGRFGQKTGAGWYRYESGSREPHPDPEVTAIIEAISAEEGITRRDISDTEIVERCLFALVNEGARILEEGVAARASDIDLIWINGYGFPRHRGGPMFWAASVGLPQVAAVVERLHTEQGDLVQPSALLLDLARAGAASWDSTGTTS